MKLKYLWISIPLWLGFQVRAQTPQPMQPFPFPTTPWYLSLSGSYGELDPDTGDFIKGKVVLETSDFLGLVGDAAAERGIAFTYTAGASKYEVQVLSDQGESARFRMNFEGVLDVYGDPTEYDREFRTFSAVIIVKGQPVGFRFFDLNKDKKLPFVEIKYDTIEVPKISVIEPAPNEIEWDISPCLLGGADNSISYDGGKSWEKWVYSSAAKGNCVFSAAEIARSTNPIIRFIVYNNLRRYIKYYTLGIGLGDEPLTKSARVILSQNLSFTKP